MRHSAYAIFALFAALLFGGVRAGTTTEYTPASSQCHKNAKQKQCKRAKPAVTKKVVAKKKPKVAAPALRPSHKPETGRFSLKQESMREAFDECIRGATEVSPTASVVDFVFQQQLEREQGGLGAWLKSLRGSPDHHGQEVCLARAFGLRGFKNLAEITDEAGKLLVEIDSPFVDVVGNEIPADRRLTRPWVRDYIVVLARDMHQLFLKEGDASIAPPSVRVTSMIRSHEDQAKQVRSGRSPADCRYHFLCSTHTSGSSLDLGLKDVGKAQRAWLETRLIADQKARKIFFIIERSHYHVFVLPPAFMGEE